MGEQTGTRLNYRSAACKFPSEVIRKKQLHRSRSMIVTMSLAVILTTYGLLVQAGLSFSPPSPLTPHAAIAIDGDADFLDTALLEGWPGDGSPENPYLIDGLDIDRGGAAGHCICISNTRVSFTISNCKLTGTGWEAGIYLENVANSELVNNTCTNNNFHGIYLYRSYSNSVVNNTCNSNFGNGIWLLESTSNTVVNNTCTSNEWDGIELIHSDANTVVNNTCTNNQAGGITLGHWFGSHNNTLAYNTCTNNQGGIGLESSNSNTVVNNICTNNQGSGIGLVGSNSNTVTNNICNNNGIGISLSGHFNSVVNNTLSGNTGWYILAESEIEESETEEIDPLILILVGLDAGIIVLDAGHRLVAGIRNFD